MQLTNVLRDVGEDLACGRIYLPADEMERRGYPRQDLEGHVVDERFVALMRHYIERARLYYAQGLAGLAFLPANCRLPIALAAHSYAAILARIEQSGFDVFTRRVRTSRREKLLLAVRLGLYHGPTGGRLRHASGAHVISFIRCGGPEARPPAHDTWRGSPASPATAPVPRLGSATAVPSLVTPIDQPIGGGREDGAWLAGDALSPLR